MDEHNKRKEVKRRFQLWIKPSVLESAKNLYEADNCFSISEFIEKAVIFYAGYLSSEQNSQYLPNIVTSTLKSIVKESDNRMGRLLFKIAVELAMTMNVVASMQDVDEDDLARLRGHCVEEIKRINGIFLFDTAQYWQNG